MTSRRLLDPVGKVLLDAADYIERHGHCRGEVKDCMGRVCVYGAFFEVRDRLETTLDAISRLERLLGRKDLIAWSDSPERTAQEVIDAMRAAAIAAPLPDTTEQEG